MPQKASKNSSKADKRKSKKKSKRAEAPEKIRKPNNKKGKQKQLSLLQRFSSLVRRIKKMTQQEHEDFMQQLSQFEELAVIAEELGAYVLSAKNELREVVAASDKRHQERMDWMNRIKGRLQEVRKTYEAIKNGPTQPPPATTVTRTKAE